MILPSKAKIGKYIDINRGIFFCAFIIRITKWTTYLTQRYVELPTRRTFCMHVHFFQGECMQIIPHHCQVSWLTNITLRWLISRQSTNASIRKTIATHRTNSLKCKRWRHRTVINSKENYRQVHQYTPHDGCSVQIRRRQLNIPVSENQQFNCAYKLPSSNN